MASNKTDIVLLSDPSKGSKARASSILQRNAKVYGPAHALNDESSSSWNSEGHDDDSQQQHWFRIDFGRVVQPTSLSVQFQAGFVAVQGRVEYQTLSDSGSSNEWHTLDDVGDVGDVEWEDSHEIQTLPLVAGNNKDNAALSSCPPCTSLRLILDECTDFYGRIILYQVQVWGKEIQA